MGHLGGVDVGRRRETLRGHRRQGMGPAGGADIAGVTKMRISCLLRHGELTLL